MLNKDVIDKLDKLIYDKFKIIYEYKFDGIVFLHGGAVKNAILGNQIKDLDFVVLTQNECQVFDFIQKHNLNYRKNAGGGYKILFNDIEVDIHSTDDLLNTGIYDIDMLFYDIDIHSFLICGFNRVVDRRIITEINCDKNALYSNKIRLKKMIKFIKNITNDNSNVKVKQNRLLWEMKLYKNRIIYHVKKIFNLWNN